MLKNTIAAKQSVVLTELGCEQFDLNVCTILEIHSFFSKTLPANSLLSWKPTKDEGYVCIEFSNKYFNLPSDREHKEVKLDKSIDPKEILMEYANKGRYTKDNVVLYFERTKNQKAG